MGNLAENLKRIKSEIKSLSSKKDASLLAVSKGQSVASIRALYDLGQRDFGESYYQELKTKRSALSESCSEIRWHFIGRLQGKKLRHILPVAYIHSVDKLKYAKKLDSLGGAAVFLQLNLDEAEGRGGFSRENLIGEFEALRLLENLEICGLSTILPKGEHTPDYWFAQVVEFKDKIEKEYGVVLPHLSMGMSADYTLALSYGATWVRVGQALFS